MIAHEEFQDFYQIVSHAQCCRAVRSPDVIHYLLYTTEGRIDRTDPGPTFIHQYSKEGIGGESSLQVTTKPGSPDGGKEIPHDLS